MSSLDSFSLSSILGVFTTTVWYYILLAAINKLLCSTAGTKTKAAKNVCASCGIAEGEEIKLEDCNDCGLIRYCSDKCREDHREQHSIKCRKDKILFTQPDSSYLGDCPICFLPLPLDKISSFWPCCSKVICKGCDAACKSNGDRICPFCREPVVTGEQGRIKVKKRIKANDPTALSQMGARCNVDGDYDAAFEYLVKAAELGDADANYQLGNMYIKGEGVEKEGEKSVYHWEKAAIGGHPVARYNLACCEEKNGDMERAVKHFIIAANLGLEESMKALWTHYSLGNITKEDLDATLRTHQAAVDATNSPQREAAEVAVKR